MFAREGQLFRQINLSYQRHYEFLHSCQLYNTLVERRFLLAHEEVTQSVPGTGAYKVIKPEIIPFISYPYEWCFSQYKAAALLTLRIQQLALDRGMSLKDASAYNIQFLGGQPILIDSLSFQIYKEGEPWVAYRQFCQQFLGPLALMSKVDSRLNCLMRSYLDGMPIDLCTKLLPINAWIDGGLLMHLKLHSAMPPRKEDTDKSSRAASLSLNGLKGIVDNLHSTVQKLESKDKQSVWSEYYDSNSYSPEAMQFKENTISRWLSEPGIKTCWDLGANTGKFSRIASRAGALTISFDSDPTSVEANYLQCSKDGETKILPLLLDLSNPSPAIGWAHCERMSLVERGPADVALALALIHHLAIANNVPLPKIAEFFSSICETLLIEFVPKSDPQVKSLLQHREDIFSNYTREQFESHFAARFQIIQSVSVPETQRVLYCMKRK